jgi:tRNA/tmRNA/rRNA uracil-C5-methylase (TrmA/RlmC/RlmD family)
VGRREGRDPWLFEGSARYYRQGRLPYPPALAAVLRDELGLDGTGRLFDVGCGPGSLTLLLAPLFEEAVGVDADPGMVAEAARQAALARVDNARWKTSHAEELPGDLGASWFTSTSARHDSPAHPGRTTCLLQPVFRRHAV